MIECLFTIPGEPKAKARPRIGKWGAYTPKETVQYENWVKLNYIDQIGKELFEGPISVNITAYFPISKSDSKKKKEQKISGEIKPIKKPDFDNIAKAICDSLNGIAYHDDAQIVEGRVVKVYSIEPRVEVCIKKVQ